MKKLFIDTSNNKQTVAKLKIGDKEFDETSDTVDRRPESILTLIDAVCNKAGIRAKQIEEVEVVEGPGSYTGLKVGVSVANALSFALGIKVNKRNIGEIVEPKYD